jgi:hypothetical protein
MRIPARTTARAICTSPNHNRTIATVKMTAPTVSRAIRTSGAAPAVGLGAGKFVGIVRCPTPQLSQFPNESVPIRTVSLAGFGNRVPSGLLPFLRFECLTSAARCGRTSYSAYGQLGETSNRGRVFWLASDAKGLGPSERPHVCTLAIFCRLDFHRHRSLPQSSPSSSLHQPRELRLPNDPWNRESYSNVRFTCHHGRTSTDRELPTPEIARRRQRTSP